MAYYHIKGVKDLKVTTVLQTSPLGEVYVPSLGLARCHKIKLGRPTLKPPPGGPMVVPEEDQFKPEVRVPFLEDLWEHAFRKFAQRPNFSQILSEMRPNFRLNS